MNTDRYTKILSQNLRSIRKSKGITAVELAKILDVSQAKISYIEHCKGVLSARDIAVLSQKLNIPVSEFFRGLNDPEDTSELKELTGHLVRFGAVLLAKPSRIPLRVVPFEKVFANSLGFIEDDRLHKGFCAALITQAASQEINVDRIFSIIGNNPFLTNKAAQESLLCVKVVDSLNRETDQINPRTKQQLQRIAFEAKQLSSTSKSDDSPTLSNEEISEIAEFVEDCLNAKK
jgi:transcriptional regulator with XRE-family HTH domain